MTAADNTQPFWIGWVGLYQILSMLAGRSEIDFTSAAADSLHFVQRSTHQLLISSEQDGGSSQNAVARDLPIFKRFRGVCDDGLSQSRAFASTFPIHSACHASTLYECDHWHCIPRRGIERVQKLT